MERYRIVSAKPTLREYRVFDTVKRIWVITKATQELAQQCADRMNAQYEEAKRRKRYA